MINRNKCSSPSPPVMLQMFPSFKALSWAGLDEAINELISHKSTHIKCKLCVIVRHNNAKT